MTRLSHLALCGIVLASTAASQTTWLVGSPLDPSIDFMEIQPAFDAAAPGDVIIVRAKFGSYQPATTSKGLTVLSTNGWIFVGGDITVENLPPNQRFAIEGFGGPIRFTARNCRGPIYMEGFTAPSAMGLPSHGRRMLFENCAYVSINSCSLWDVTCDRTTMIVGTAAFTGSTDENDPTIGYPALTILDGDVTFAGGFIQGPESYPLTPIQGPPAVYMQGGRLRFTGKDPFREGIAGSLTFPPFPNPATQAPAIVSDGGTVILDPDISTGGGMFGTSTFVTEDLAYTQVQKLFSPMQITIPLAVTGPPGASTVVAVSLPHSPLATPLGELWLDPSPGGIVAAAMGVLDATGQFSTRSPLNGPWAFGTVAAFQAVIVDQGQISLAFPAVGVMGLNY